MKIAVATVPKGEHIIEISQARLVTAGPDGITTQEWRELPLNDARFTKGD